MRASPEYHRLCKNGDERTVMTNAEVCGPCFAALIMPSHAPPKAHATPARRGICRHCGKERQVNSRDLCRSRCARLGLEDQYPVVASRGKKATHG